MYRVPLDLDLSSIVGKAATQVRVGQFDLQFIFGPVSFVVESPVELVRAGQVVGRWEESRWPDPGFFEVMNVRVSTWKIPNDRSIVIRLESGLEIHLSDDSDEFECIHISNKERQSSVVI